MKHAWRNSFPMLGACAALFACAATCHAAEGDAPPVQAAPVSSAGGETAEAPAASSRVVAAHVVSALALQREDAADLAAVPRDQPVALPGEAPARWSASAELAGHAYRLSMSRGSLDVGMSFDTAERASRTHDVRIDGQGPLMSSLPSLSLGLRRGAEGVGASSLLARAAGGRADYSSKVGIEWKPAESQMQFLRDGLGMRLDPNERITMKLRKGLLSLYLQRRF